MACDLSMTRRVCLTASIPATYF